MWDFAFAQENVLFGIAICLMLIIAFFEGVGVLFGAALSDTLDGFIPDFDLDADPEIGDVGSQGALSRLLGWLRVGKVPILMLLVVFLFWFGVIGYSFNFVAYGVFGLMLPSVISAPAAVFLALPCTRFGGGILEWAMPKDETSAIKRDVFVGRIAHVTVGTATVERAAEAKVIGPHGTAHYILVRPDTGHGPFTSVQPLLIVRQHGSEFIVIAADESVAAG